MREQATICVSDELVGLHEAVTWAIETYAQGLLTIELLALRVQMRYKELLQKEGVEPGEKLLRRIALHICSYEVYLAWCSHEWTKCELAYANIRRYLFAYLRKSSYAEQLSISPTGLEDVVNNTLELLYQEELHGHGPDDPVCFLGWTRTLLLRQAYQAVQPKRHAYAVSLDEQAELFAEEIVDSDRNDPAALVQAKEVRAALLDAIADLKNTRYRSVLYYTFFAEKDEEEQAELLQARVKDIYLWKCRALETLRARPGLLQRLQALR